ncbi:dual specificity protein phosphatase 1-like isoform X2 [Olea europaea var. sylvestris]|uniref:dual specificity protein phosphatase 1-like isoform X2 n=1 Tax=Olea europaea var. sylvestris TaxID=158386 RepID=UPI000C1CFAA1|nr:dual specificity protein phosphatase 1-like isoform X2 [Olea europaea var. sylvestris]
MNDTIFKDRIAALLQVVQATKIIKDDNIPCKIEEGLYLGSLGAANNKSTLRSLNITHILTVAHSLSPAHSNDFIYKTIPVMDREDVDISQYFSECFNFIEEDKKTGGGVLVHCFAGRSRSVTIVVAYLMMKIGISLSEALEHVKRKRPVVSPTLALFHNWKTWRDLFKDRRWERLLGYRTSAIH